MCSPAAVSCAAAEEAPKTMLSLVEKDSGRTIDIRSGETVEITLPENATTGYRWAIDHCDEEIIEALATEPHYPAKAVGSGHHRADDLAQPVRARREKLFDGGDRRPSFTFGHGGVPHRESVTSTSPACHDPLSPSAILQNLQHATRA